MKYGHEATHDPLTGLPNRALLMDRLAVMLRHSERADSTVAVLFRDLDGFKRINDSLGHKMGDSVLVEVARRFASTVRGEDTLARLGGDEFVAVCQTASEQVPVQLAERLTASLQQAIVVQGHRVHIATSIGIAVADSTTKNPEDLVRNADLAMYRAKMDRRGGFEMFDTAMHARAIERLTLEQNLGPALERNEFCLYYQPLVVAPICGWSALRPCRGGGCPPGAWFRRWTSSASRRSLGFILTFGAWVLGEACRQLSAWRSQGAADFVVGVNVSARQLLDTALLRHVITTLDTYGLDPSALVLELTESALMKDVASSLGMLEDFHRLGVAISVDDFGTGHSSLSYLAKMPLDSIKIDKSFIDGLEADERSRMLASTIISLARNLGVRSVAEGVERESQLTILQDLGCDVVQGYFIGHPEPPNHVAKTWLSG
jgi:diguanylate cyclase (GGDEF)-like protein